MVLVILTVTQHRLTDDCLTDVQTKILQAKKGLLLPSFSKRLARTYMTGGFLEGFFRASRLVQLLRVREGWAKIRQRKEVSKERLQ